MCWAPALHTNEDRLAELLGADTGRVLIASPLVSWVKPPKTDPGMF